MPQSIRTFATLFGARVIQIRLPKLDELLLRWWQVRPLLLKATRYSGGGYLPEDIAKEVFANIVHIWFVENEDDDLIAVVVGGPQQMPQARWFKITFVAGRRLAEWWPIFVEMADAEARKTECSRIYSYGRPGWVRFWKSRGAAVHVASECIVRTL